MRTTSLDEPIYVAAEKIADRLTEEAIEMIVNRLAFRCGLGEIGTDAFEKAADYVLHGPNHWLDDRLTEEMPETEDYPDERLNQLFFTARDEVIARVIESRRAVIGEAQDRLLRTANKVTIRVTRTGIEVLNVRSNY
jgi:hypothetical protein